MQKRTILFGSYNTAEHGWTLSGCTLSAPEQKTQYIEKTGGDGSWDLSTVMTDGIPRYKDRTLTVTLECSKGTRDDREDLINEMVNSLDGLTWRVVLPDRPQHFLSARLHVAVDFNTPAYAQVTVTGMCEPWLYAERETVVPVRAVEQDPAAPNPETLKRVNIHNRGRKAVIPLLTVSNGTYINLRMTPNISYDVQLVNDTNSGQYSENTNSTTYQWPGLVLMPGLNEFYIDGDAVLTLTYREAVLR